MSNINNGSISSSSSSSSTGFNRKLLLLKQHNLSAEPLLPDDRITWQRKLSNLRTLGPDLRQTIAECNLWAIEHALHAYHVMELLVQSVLTDEAVVDLATSSREFRAVMRSANRNTAIGHQILRECEQKSSVAFQRVLARLFLLHDILMAAPIAPSSPARGRPLNLCHAFELLLPRFLERMSLLCVAVAAPGSQHSADDSNSTSAESSKTIELEPGSPVHEIVTWLRNCWSMWFEAGALDKDVLEQVGNQQWGFLLLHQQQQQQQEKGVVENSRAKTTDVGAYDAAAAAARRRVRQD